MPPDDAPAWVPELTRMLRGEMADTRRINGELVEVLRDLRDELAHLRESRAREEREKRLAERFRVKAKRG